MQHGRWCDEVAGVFIRRHQQGDALLGFLFLQFAEEKIGFVKNADATAVNIAQRIQALIDGLGFKRLE